MPDYERLIDYSNDYRNIQDKICEVSEKLEEIQGMNMITDVERLERSKYISLLYLLLIAKSSDELNEVA